MLDIQFIRDNAAAVQKAADVRGVSFDVAALLAVDAERTAIQKVIETLRAERNTVAEKMTVGLPDDQKQALIVRGRAIKERIEQEEERYAEIDGRFHALMVQVPNIPSFDTPLGKSDADNTVVHMWGEKPVFDFTPKPHWEIGRDLDIIDFDRGVKVGGYRGYFLKNEGVSLVMGLMMYAMQKMIVKGYIPMIPPTMVKEFSLFGSGYFKGVSYNAEVDEIYQVATSDKEADGKMSKEKKFLIGTAEPSLLAYYAGEVLDEAQLPIRICGFSQCYRSEIGSYGKDTKGLYRVHEFMKIEQVVICRADEEESRRLQDEMCAISQEIHADLGFPYYRQLGICTGDLGIGKYRQYDHEVWLPGMEKWAETGSASILTDWQARRLNVKYTDIDGKRKYVYMLNNTALPSPRPLIAIIENFQQADGSVKVPAVLAPYMPVESREVIRRK